ncbi:MAG: sigma-70 family RNA polymerase sigma factor [Pirellulales bacterium]
MDDSSPTDAELVAQSRAGQTDAFGQLYDRFAPLVREVGFGETFDTAATADLVQEAFLRAYRGLEKLREPERFGAWVVGIARQVSRERRRALRRDRHEFVDGRTLHAAAADDAVNAIDRAEESRWILAQVSELDEREQVAIHAFYLHGRDVQQASELLGLSRSGTYALLARAVARLAQRVRGNEQARGTKR